MSKILLSMVFLMGSLSLTNTGLANSEPFQEYQRWVCYAYSDSNSVYTGISPHRPRAQTKALRKCNRATGASCAVDRCDGERCFKPWVCYASDNRSATYRAQAPTQSRAEYKALRKCNAQAAGCTIYDCEQLSQEKCKPL